MAVITTPFGAVQVDTFARRVRCKGAYRRRPGEPVSTCPVQIPADKRSGRCYGCERTLTKPNNKTRPTRYDPELGLLMYCAPCDEWWPADEEFWYLETRKRKQTPDAIYFHCRVQRGSSSELRFVS